jgi:predicted metal-dependent hydrolase
MTSETFPPDFWQGVEQFNQQQFYACHDTLEAIWMESAQPQKSFYQGILQIAVALYHFSNCNWRGAMILLGEGIRRLQPYLPDYGSVDVEALVNQSGDFLHALQQLQGLNQLESQTLKTDDLSEMCQILSQSATIALQVPTLQTRQVLDF